MKFLLFSLFLILLTRSIRIGDKIKINGLSNNASKYNGQEATIISLERGTKNLEEFRYGVEIGKTKLSITRDKITGGTERLRGDPEQKSMSDILEELTISRENVYTIPSNWKEQQELNNEEIEELKKYATLLRTMTPEQWAGQGIDEKFARATGTEIDLNFGFKGMVYICDHIFDRKERVHIGYPWDGVGQFQK